MSKGTFVLAAGGTGGHLFPAQALAEELNRRGYTIHLMTDERVRDYGKSFPAAETHVVPSATLSLSKPWLAPGRALRLYGGYRAARHQPWLRQRQGGRGHDVRLGGGERLAIVANPLVGHQVDGVATPDQLLRQRLGGKQMSAGSAGRQNEGSPAHRA